MPGPVMAEQLAKILIGRVGVANVELHGLADANVVGDAHGAGVPIDTDDVADEEVAALEAVLVLVDDQTDVHTVLDEVAFLTVEFLPELLELGERGLAAEFLDDVFVALGDDEVLADGPASLRDD